MLEETKQIIKETKGIHGLMTYEELALLCRFARSAFSIAELGCYKGRSLIAMGLANPQVELYGIDSFGDMSYRGYQGSTLEETKSNLASRGVKAMFYVGTTDEVASRFDKTIDMLHVDAGHSYQECMNDLLNYTPKIAPGGVVCIHDYGHARKDSLERPEVKEAVDDWAADNPEWVEVERSGTMIAFRHMIAEAGILYIAFGEKAVENVALSASLLKAFAPDLPICVITDERMKLEIASQARNDRFWDYVIEHRDMDPGARSIKSRIYSLSPFRKTLYLDADTEMKSSPQHGFDLLELVDMVIGQDTIQIFNENQHPHMDKKEMAVTRRETNGGEGCYYNTGVMFFGRNERLKALMQRWHEEWQRYGKQDQPGMFRAMYVCPVRIAGMRKPWNTHHIKEAQFIFHAHRRASREGAPK
jgi:predicted O-methyltransferase YrrM